MEDSFRARLIQAITLWNSAERVIKQAELVGGEIVFPSINELRYAGRWIILALSAHVDGRENVDDLTSALDALSYAILCCMQAKHDAIDSIVLYVHEKISKLSDRYTNRVIGMYVTDFDQLLVKVDKIDRAILVSRENRQERAELYDGIVRDHLPLIVEFLERVARAEILINEELEDEKRKEDEEKSRHQILVETLTSESKRNKRYFNISLVINAILLLIGALALVPLLKDVHPKILHHELKSSESPSKKPVG